MYMDWMLLHFWGVQSRRIRFRIVWSRVVQSREVWSRMGRLVRWRGVEEVLPPTSSAALVNMNTFLSKYVAKGISRQLKLLPYLPVCPQQEEVWGRWYGGWCLASCCWCCHCALSPSPPPPLLSRCYTRKLVVELLSSRTLSRLVLPQLDLEDWSWWWCGGRGDIPQMLTAPETEHSWKAVIRIGGSAACEHHLLWWWRKVFVLKAYLEFSPKMFSEHGFFR